MGARSERGALRHLVYLAEAALLQRWLEREGFEHVHAHFGTNSTAVALLCRDLGGPTFSFTVHGSEEFDAPRALSLEEKISAARFVIAVCDYGRSQLYRQCPAESWERIHVVRCSIDAAWRDCAEAPIPSAPRLVCVGRLCEQKGQLLLVRAVAALVQSGRDVELDLVGDGPLRGALEREVARLDVKQQVRLLGTRDQAGVMEALRAARAFVLPSFAEGLPVAIMEAMAMARPVVSTYVAGIPELVIPGENGWLVAAGSLTGLGEALEEVLDASPERLGEMGRAGRRRVLRLHDAASNAVRLAELLRSQDDSAASR